MRTESLPLILLGSMGIDNPDLSAVIESNKVALDNLVASADDTMSLNYSATVVIVSAICEAALKIDAENARTQLSELANQTALSDEATVRSNSDNALGVYIDKVSSVSSNKSVFCHTVEFGGALNLKSNFNPVSHRIGIPVIYAFVGYHFHVKSSQSDINISITIEGYSNDSTSPEWSKTIQLDSSSKKYLSSTSIDINAAAGNVSVKVVTCSGNIASDIDAIYTLSMYFRSNEEFK